jgi:signal transduction histidine kinase
MSSLKINKLRPANEEKRLEALLEYEILNDTQDEELDDLVELASRICDTPVSLVTLLDEDWQWFKANKGMDAEGTERDVAFCNHTILQDDLLEIPDATKDERFKDNPLVHAGKDKVRFYAGVSLKNRNGYNLGSLCVIDDKPRQLSEDQKKTLKVLARQVARKLDYDLNKRRLQEQAHSLESANERLEKLSYLNVNLLSAMAHDLKNTMGGAEAVFSLIQAKVELEDDLSMLVNEELKSLSQSHKLLSDMVTWGSSYVKSGEIQKIEVHPAEVVDAVLVALEDQAKRKNMSLKNKVSEDFQVKTDQEMLKFLFRNLVQNGIKFTKDGKVTVGFDEEKEAFYVRDEGKGMTEKQLKKLFSWDRSKVSKGTAGEPGSGIGLMLCRDFVERHDGEIWATSSEGVGTCMYFTLWKKHS